MTKQAQKQWALNHLLGQYQSGRTVLDYCKSEHLIRSVFYRWRKEYAEEFAVLVSNDLPFSIPSSSSSSIIPIIINDCSTPPTPKAEGILVSVVFHFPNGVEATTSLEVFQLVELLHTQPLCSG